MNNLILAQVLGGLFGNARQRRTGRVPAGLPGGVGGGLGGAALGTVLAGMMRGRGARTGARGGASRGLMVALLLPLAMRWVERNGGIGAVLKRFKDKGYDRQAQSWVGTGDNQAIGPEALDEVVGREELSRLSQQLGVEEAEVKESFAEILPEMVNQLTPDGRVDPQADDVLKETIPLVEQELQSVQRETYPQ
jgi:uncharacterized protein YidB (DUF937 family)